MTLSFQTAIILGITHIFSYFNAAFYDCEIAAAVVINDKQIWCRILFARFIALNPLYGQTLIKMNSQRIPF